ncbi:hypothetical protein F511_01790 [Dorcoceras hygrometricum]|uniref:Uncharacterized protein n=1 Tax=Dorcoceras hygrometricum TaxID=472368 RepID=A0A2Z7ASF9_9LAMI|nr:hypothetical protein F511_01790 [Dorcoceras hygrometricum]
MAKNKSLNDHYAQEITNFNIQLLTDLCSSSTHWEKREGTQNEKQISVDPVSIKPATWEGKGRISSKFLSFSLPNSVTSSPLKQLHQKKKKAKRKDGNVTSPLSRQHSVALTNLERLRERHLRRSKSCGEGRTSQPSVDFDLLSRAIKVNTFQEIERRPPEYCPTNNHHMYHGVAPKNSELVPGDQDDRVKCGALCLFLPGFGKNAKPVRSRKDIPHMEVNEGHVVVSQRVSLEKFECGSWRSSAIIMNNEDDGDSASSMFFDLPMELIRCSNFNDAELPITTGFVFDKNTTTTTSNNTGRKGGIKNSSTINNAVNSSAPSASRLLHSESLSNSCRHVQFSATSPTLYPASPISCITPRLRKAREEFNAFLEAQNA